jgi:hypothetical protein
MVCFIFLQLCCGVFEPQISLIVSTRFSRTTTHQQNCVMVYLNHKSHLLCLLGSLELQHIIIWFVLYFYNCAVVYLNHKSCPLCLRGSVEPQHIITWFALYFYNCIVVYLNHKSCPIYPLGSIEPQHIST